MYPNIPAWPRGKKTLEISLNFLTSGGPLVQQFFTKLTGPWPHHNSGLADDDPTVALNTKGAVRQA